MEFEAAFLDYAKLEPKLLSLQSRVREHVQNSAGSKDYCAYEAWYRRGFKRQLTELVGFNSQVIGVNTTKAYDTCYKYLLDLLLPCGHPEGDCTA
jgi:hypothetical protein